MSDNFVVPPLWFSKLNSGEGVPFNLFARETLSLCLKDVSVVVFERG
jgi:hypothetical protein